MTAAPPVKKLSDPAADRRSSSAEPREFQWFKPRKRRASVYEDVTVDTQPSIHRHVLRGWPVCFKDGRGTWDDGSTMLRSTDWYDFRDPGEMWERPYYQQGAALERQVEASVQSAAEHRLFDDFTPEWAEFLRENLQVPAFIEHGLWLPTATSARDCLSDSIAECVVIEAGMKQRLAQAIVLYAMDLEPHFGEFSMPDAKKRFLTDPVWQPARRYLEELQTLTDWAETIVAVNLCFEPLVGVLVRREFGIRAAVANGDSVTPQVTVGAQLEWDWVRGWTAAFSKLVVGDAQHGSHNRDVMASWLDKWLPAARLAAQALAPLAERVPNSTISIEASIERIERDAMTYFEAAEMRDLAEGVR